MMIRRIAGAVLLVAFLYGLAFSAASLMPEQPKSFCSCTAEDPGCYEKDFAFDNGIRAHCAIYSAGNTCCQYSQR